MVWLRPGRVETMGIKDAWEMMLEVSKIFWILGSQGAQLQLTFTEFPVPETRDQR